MEKRAIRQVGLVFTLAGLFAFALRRRLRRLGLVPARLALDDHRERLERVVHAAARRCCMGLSLALVGVGLVLFTKKLLPHETAVQDKHDGSHFDRVTAGATLVRAASTTAGWPAAS